MNAVFIVDAHRVPRFPVSPGMARRLLRTQQAAVLRRYPFTLILKHAAPPLPPVEMRLKIDPGSKTTGLALLQGHVVVWAAELQHRSGGIVEALRTRRGVRRSRRQRHTRYRAPRFNNRTRAPGWLAPSLMSRVHNIMTWVSRLQRFAPVTAISVEYVRFDTQKMENPDISGVEYQQGTLAGYEVREYLYERWQYTCAYCRKKNPPYEVEHVIPKSRGGSDRINNLVLACKPCNAAKGNQTAAEFGYPSVQRQCRLPLRDAAAVNSTRKALYKCLMATGLPVEGGSGGRTKWNRTRQGLPKTHWLDAACVGASTPERLMVKVTQPLVITAKGHGNRRMAKINKYGFPTTHRTRQKLKHGFQTGDIVRGASTGQKHAGTYIGRLKACNARSSGDIHVPGRGIKQDRVSVRYVNMTRLHRNDGYTYSYAAKKPVMDVVD